MDSKIKKIIILCLIVLALIVTTNFIINTARQNADDASREAEIETFLWWFGSGFYMNTDTQSVLDFDPEHYLSLGLYNPETIRLMNVWQDEGLGGWFNLDRSVVVGGEEIPTYDAIRNMIDYDLNCQILASDVELLLYGGFPIFGEQDDSGFSFGGERFLNAVARIDMLFACDNALLHAWRELIDSN